MRALQANFIISGICICFTELLLWKNQKRSTRYPKTLQKWDSIADIFPGAYLGRGHRKHVHPDPPLFFLELHSSEKYKNKQHK